jgi:hypothetical protein
VGEANRHKGRGDGCITWLREACLPGVTQGPLSALRGVQEDIGEVEPLDVLAEGAQGQRVPGAVCELADGGIDAGRLGLGGLSRDALGKEHAAAEVREAGFCCRSQHLQALVERIGWVHD